MVIFQSCESLSNSGYLYFRIHLHHSVSDQPELSMVDNCRIRDFSELTEATVLPE